MGDPHARLLPREALRAELATDLPASLRPFNGHHRRVFAFRTISWSVAGTETQTAVADFEAPWTTARPKLVDPTAISLRCFFLAAMRSVKRLMKRLDLAIRCRGGWTGQQNKRQARREICGCARAGPSPQRREPRRRRHAHGQGFVDSIATVKAAKPSSDALIYSAAGSSQPFGCEARLPKNVLAMYAMQVPRRGTSPQSWRLGREQVNQLSKDCDRRRRHGGPAFISALFPTLH